MAGCSLSSFIKAVERMQHSVVSSAMQQHCIDRIMIDDRHRLRRKANSVCLFVSLSVCVSVCLSFYYVSVCHKNLDHCSCLPIVFPPHPLALCLTQKRNHHHSFLEEAKRKALYFHLLVSEHLPLLQMIDFPIFLLNQECACNNTIG